MRALAVCLAAVAALATGCRDDTAPAWDYPRLTAALNALTAALAHSCATVQPDHCADSLDRLDPLAHRAFTEVLDHRLLDQACLDAERDVRRARALRRAAAVHARARPDLLHPALEQAVAAEQAAYRRLLAALDTVRTAPPPAGPTQPV
ncbi:hypothetical protein ACFWFZ_27685 [Streptomyces sp. NPDC060232]|uniref:hypothetical protein n=1 Tax=Streptomyces sp. NPDC060232 TaxID=3347079 RepID=UPI003656C6B8